MTGRDQCAVRSRTGNCGKPIGSGQGAKARHDQQTHGSYCARQFINQLNSATQREKDARQSRATCHMLRGNDEQWLRVRATCGIIPSERKCEPPTPEHRVLALPGGHAVVARADVATNDRRRHRLLPPRYESAAAGSPRRLPQRESGEDVVFSYQPCMHRALSLGINRTKSSRLDEGLVNLHGALTARSGDNLHTFYVFLSEPIGNMVVSAIRGRFPKRRSHVRWPANKCKSRREPPVDACCVRVPQLKNGKAGSLPRATQDRVETSQLARLATCRAFSGRRFADFSRSCITREAASSGRARPHSAGGLGSRVARSRT